MNEIIDICGSAISYKPSIFLIYSFTKVTVFINYLARSVKPYFPNANKDAHAPANGPPFRLPKIVGEI